jgi:hypothetical protein
VVLEHGNVLVETKARDAVDHYLGRCRGVEGTVEVSSPQLRGTYDESSAFHWKRITLLDGDDHPTTELRLGSPFSLVLEGEVYQSISSTRLGFSIDAGSTVFNAFQVDERLPERLEAGPVCYRARIAENSLAPGRYSISLGAQGPDVHDLIEVAMVFAVQPTPAPSARPRWFAHSTGIIVSPVEWSREPSPP